MSQKSKITMVKKNPCPYCDRAQNLFNRKGWKVDIIDLTDRLHELPDYKEKYGWQTVPIILINDQLIGGYSDLKALDEEGKLDEMVMGKSTE